MDPLEPEPLMLPGGEDELSLAMRSAYQEHWSSIRTHHHPGRVQDVYNYRITDLNLHNLMDELQQLFHIQTVRFRINASFGFILRHIETEELRYYHSSHNQGRLLDVPPTITNQEDFDDFVESLMQEDILEWAKQQRQDTKWIVVFVTNMSVYVNRLPDHPVGCEGVQLPDYIKQNNYIIGLDRSAYRNSVYSDALCFFRALAIHCKAPRKPTGSFETKVCAIFEEMVGGDPKHFEGVHLTDLPTLEQKLQLNINVFELVKDEDKKVMGKIVQRSHHRYDNTMNLNLFENHFSLITNLDRYCESFGCRLCGKQWKKFWLLKRHEHTCDQVTKKKYVGGSYHSEPTVFELMEDEGIIVNEKDRYYPFRITYDYECYFDTTDLPPSSKKLYFKAKHVPLSVSICSNVPGFVEPQCFVTEGSAEQLVRQMLEYMHSIQETAVSLIVDQHQCYYNDLVALLQTKQQLEEAERDGEMMNDKDEEQQRKRSHPLAKVKVMYDTWINEIPVVGFNSGKYDVNVIKPHLLKKLKEELQFVVKKNNAFMCLKTSHLKFVDIRNYIAPGFDYATYLKAYQCSVSKGFFPYEWMTNPDKLKCTALPDYEDFYSTLKNRNITEEDYAYCQRIWSEQKMNTMRDYLVWYNNRDVVPFLEAVEKQFNFYQMLKVDMFKDGISVPGLTLKYLFKTTEANFTLINQQNADLHELIRSNNVGGPSIIFHRYHEAYKTKIREQMYAETAKMCQSIVGYDANALYLWCLMQDMPTGTYVRRKEEDQFRPHQPDVWGKTPSEWLEWESYNKGIHIRHKYNGKEKKRLGKDNCLLMDGVDR